MAVPLDTPRHPHAEADPAAVPVLTPRRGDAFLARCSGAVHTYVDGMRAAHPEATADDLRHMLTQRYLVTVGASGGAAGVASAARGLRTGTAVAVTAGQAGAFLAASAAYVLGSADLEGVPVDDAARRRALVLAALLGRGSSTFLSEELGVTAPTWGRTLALDLPVTTVARVNKRLYGRVARFSLTRLGAVAAGRLMPYGVGAVIGYTGGRGLGRIVVAGVEEAFGRPALA